MNDQFFIAVSSIVLSGALTAGLILLLNYFKSAYPLKHHCRKDGRIISWNKNSDTWGVLDSIRNIDYCPYCGVELKKLSEEYKEIDKKAKESFSIFFSARQTYCGDKKEN